MKATVVLAWIGVTCILHGGRHLQAQQGDSPAGASTPAVSGSGKTNFIPIWTNSSTLGSSTLVEKSSRVGIGTTTPTTTLEVNGTAKFDQAVTFAAGQSFPGTASLGSNTFTATQTIATGDLSVTGGNIDLPQTTGSGAGVIALGGYTFLHGCCGASTFNTFIGAQSGNFYSTGTFNTATGFGTLSADTSGWQNTASGAQALGNNATGYNNTASGALALLSNTTGYQNTADGYYSLAFNNTGNDNTANGEAALYSNTAGSGNTASGSQALFFTTTGNYNTAVGEIAGSYNSTGSYNTFLGFGADVGSGNPSNGTAVGACVLLSSSNTLVLGAPAGGGIRNCSGLITANTLVGVDVSNPTNILTVLQGGGHAIADGWDVYSSRRWKSDIRPLEGALGKVERLRGVEYTYTADGKRDIGMIAEEVGRVVPEVVSYEENGKDARGIDYARLTALLVEAVKQQQAEIVQQRKQIDQLESQVRALQVKN